MPSSAHAALPSLTEASAFDSAGFQTQPNRFTFGAEVCIAMSSNFAGCNVPKPATLVGRVEPSVHGPSGTPNPGGETTNPNTCGRPRLFARKTVCVATVESDTIKS